MAWYLSFREGNQQKTKQNQIPVASSPWHQQLGFDSALVASWPQSDWTSKPSTGPGRLSGPVSSVLRAVFLMLMLLIHLSIHLRFIQYLRIKINIDKFHKSILIHWCLYSVENWFYKWILSTTISLKERVWPYIYIYIRIYHIHFCCI